MSLILSCGRETVLPRLEIRPTSLSEQVATVVFGLGVKPTYMLLSLVLVAWLWRARDRGLSTMRRALLVFFAGEAFCALNFAFAKGDSLALEIGHGLGMVGMGALLPWGVIQLFDERVLRYQDPKATCALQRFCAQCWKREPVACGLQRLFLFAAPALALSALIPITAPLLPLRIEVSIFGTPVVYGEGLLQQIFELRIYPAAATLLLLVSFALLLPGRRTFSAAQFPFFAGLGFLTFSLGRFLLYQGFRDAPIWGDAWEEMTELITVLGVGVSLLAFRRPLGLPWFDPGSPQAAGGA